MCAPTGGGELLRQLWYLGTQAVPQGRAAQSGGSCLQTFFLQTFLPAVARPSRISRRARRESNQMCNTSLLLLPNRSASWLAPSRSRSLHHMTTEVLPLGTTARGIMTTLRPANSESCHVKGRKRVV